MNKIICIFLAALSAATTQAQFEAPPPDGGDVRLLTLESVLTEVETTNLDTLIAREGVNQAIESIRRTRAGLLPQANVMLGQSRARTVFFGQGDPIHSTIYNRFGADLQVNLSVINMTSIALYRESKHTAEIARFQYDAALEDIKLAAAEVFVVGLRAREAHELSKNSLERAGRLRKIAADRVEAGRNNPIDLSRAKLEESSARQTVIEREAAVFSADQQMKRFLNLDLMAPIELIAYAIESDDALPRYPEINLGDVLKERSDYLAQLKSKERARLLVKAADWQRLPSLNLFGSYGFATETPLDGDEDSAWSMGVSISVPVFEGFRTRAEKSIAQSQLRAVERRVLDVEKKVHSEILVAWENLRAAQSRLVVSEENLALAKEAYQFALDRFREGASDNRELIEAQLGLESAETNLLDRRLQNVLTHLYYARACGSVEAVLESKVRFTTHEESRIH